MLQTLTGNFWTHKANVGYASLISGTPDMTLNLQIMSNLGGGNYTIQTGTAIQLHGWTATVISGTGIGQTGVVGAYEPLSTNIYFSTNFSPTALDNTSVIQFTESYSFKDLTLVGIPANHIITGVKVATLSSFTLDTGYSVWVYVGNDTVFATPINGGDLLVTRNIVHNTYGMGCVTIPEGSGDSYEYGSFRWFTFSGPGGPTYSRNQLPGNPTIGSYCLPQRLDAHDMIARFCILSDTTNTPATPTLLNPLDGITFSNVTAGDVEITVQYTAL